MENYGEGTAFDDCSYLKRISEKIELEMSNGRASQTKMNLNELKYKAAEFSDRTFGVNNPISGPLHHVHEELDEIINCLNTGTDPLDEFADCFLMLVDAFRKYYGNDVDMQKLIDASSDKLDINEKRTWGKPDKNGVIKHIKDPDQTLLDNRDKPKTMKSTLTHRRKKY